MLSKARCKNVEAVNVDFLTVDPVNSEYSRATHMYVYRIFFFFFSHASSPYACHYSLLDPSCSGSGIVNRLDHLLESGQFRELLLYSTLISRRERRDGGTGEPPHQTRQLSTDDDQARYEM